MQNVFYVAMDIVHNSEQALVPSDTLRCPVCAFDHNRVTKTERVPGNDNYGAVSDGFTGRGDLIVLDIECEAGHYWQLCIGFHKGISNLFARTVEISARERELMAEFDLDLYQARQVQAFLVDTPAAQLPQQLRQMFEQAGRRFGSSGDTLQECIVAYVKGQSLEQYLGESPAVPAFAGPLPTPEQIVARLEYRKQDDPFAFEVVDYLSWLDYAHAKPYLKDTVTESKWEQDRQPLTRENVLQRMEEYMPFAWDKARNKRGLSASRSVQHYIAWTWLIGDQDFSEQIDKMPFNPYGEPALRAICERYNIPIPE